MLKKSKGTQRIEKATEINQSIKCNMFQRISLTVRVNCIGEVGDITNIYWHSNNWLKMIPKEKENNKADSNISV